MQTGGAQQVVVRTAPPKKKSFFSPLVLGFGALVILAGLGIAGVVGLYLAGIIGPPRVSGSPTPTPEPTASAIPASTPDLVAIPGGSFKMGNNDGSPDQRPEHDVQVPPFKMDRTEVTNAEFQEFMKTGNYKPVSTEKYLAHWVNGAPVKGQEKMPVRFVNLDDVKAFVAWRSKRDSVTYRLPTEAEWEFAARNGSKESPYPWGDKFDPKCAVIDQTESEPTAVGTRKCADDWGVVDLIGNVFEWTSTELSLYPGNDGTIKAVTKPNYMIRGGSFFQKSTGPAAINSMFRVPAPEDQRSPELGFRLVTAP